MTKIIETIALFPTEIYDKTTQTQTINLPDDRNTIRPLARRTNGNIICVKRAAPMKAHFNYKRKALQSFKLPYQVS